MSELEELNKLIHDYEERLKILKMELVVAERKKEKEKHYKESKKIFKIIREQACDVIQGSDAWTMSEDYKRRIDMQLGKRVDNQLSILFLGGAAHFNRSGTFHLRGAA
jgi:hypothetical protein